MTKTNCKIYKFKTYNEVITYNQTINNFVYKNK